MISRGGSRDLERLDDVLAELRMVLRRPAYRRRLGAHLDEGATFVTLRTIRAVSRVSATQPCVADVAEALGIDRSTASRSVDDAVQQGYLRRTASDGDRRRASLAVTQRGRDLMARMAGARRAVLADATRDWTAADVRGLIAAVDRLLAGFEQVDPAGKPPCRGPGE